MSLAGCLEVQPDVVTVLADTALHGQDIDRARAEEAKYAALENIKRQCRHSTLHKLSLN